MSPSIRPTRAGWTSRVRLALLLAVLPFFATACGDSPTTPTPTTYPPPYRWVNDSPEWSPGGRYLLFNHYPQSNADYALGEYEIWLLDLQTGTTRYLVPGRQAHWMGDNAFTYSDEGGVYRYNLATSQASLFFSCGASMDAHTSADGRMVALASSCPDTTGFFLRVWLVDAASMSSHRISQPGGAWWRDPTWSPEGTRLAVAHIFDSSGFTNLCVTDTSGNQLARLTSAVYFDDQDPTWSRDGEWVYWDHLGSNGNQPQTGIWRVHPDGTGMQSVITNAFYPSLAPSDTAMVFAQFDSLNTLDLWMSDKDGHHQRRVFPPLPARSVAAPGPPAVQANTSPTAAYVARYAARRR